MKLYILPALLMLSISNAAYAADAPTGVVPISPNAAALQDAPAANVPAPKIVIPPPPPPAAPLTPPPVASVTTPVATTTGTPAPVAAATATAPVATAASTAANVGQCHIGISFRPKATPDTPSTIDKNLPDAPGLVTQATCRSLCDQITKPLTNDPANVSGSSRCSFSATTINDTQWQMAP